MKCAVIVAAIAALAVSAVPSVEALSYKAHRNAIIDTVNLMNSTWSAGVNGRWDTEGSSWEMVARQLGALPPKPGQKLAAKQITPLKDIPATFDARDQWPMCKSIGEVRDQSDCGSCWAFGASEAATDRICISTKGASTPHLSAADLLSCCGFQCGNGCDGGYPGSAWSWMASTGIVSGGNFGDLTSCVSYPFKLCDHHVTGKYGPCDATEYSTPSCATSCDSGSTYTIPYAQDKHVFASSYSINNDVAAIQTEILTNGPVEGAFTVYADFPTYKSGVYQHVTGDELGGHAIRILGWGTESGTDYWLVANSWNEGWGDKGFFKILRGSDHCGIEDGIVAGLYQNTPSA